MSPPIPSPCCRYPVLAAVWGGHEGSLLQRVFIPHFLDERGDAIRPHHAQGARNHFVRQVERLDSEFARSVKASIDEAQARAADKSPVLPVFAPVDSSVTLVSHPRLLLWRAFPSPAMQSRRKAICRADRSSEKLRQRPRGQSRRDRTVHSDRDAITDWLRMRDSVAVTRLL